MTASKWLRPLQRGSKRTLQADTDTFPFIGRLTNKDLLLVNFIKGIAAKVSNVALQLRPEVVWEYASMEHMQAVGS